MDGSIRISTKIDNKEAKADLHDLERMVEKTGNNIKATGQAASSFGDSLSKATGKAGKSISKLQDELAAVEAEIKRIQDDTDADLASAITDEQTINLLKIEEIALEKLIKKRDELIAKLNEYAAAQNKADQKQADRDAGQAIKGASKEVSAGVADQAFISQISSVREYKAILRDLQAEMQKYEAEAARVAQAKGLNPNDVLAANQQYQDLSRRVRSLADGMSTFKKSASSAFQKGRKEANSFGTAMQKATKKVSRLAISMFGMRSIYAAISRVTSTYLSNNEALAQSVAGLGNTIAEMFGPAIEYIINLLITGMAYLNAFVKGLTGVDFAARANAKALAKQAASTKQLAAEEKKRQSVGFDEQTKLTDTSSSAGSGAAGGAGAGTLDLPDIGAWGDKMVKAGKWVKDHLEEILVLVGSIYAGLLAWKISRAFTDSLKTSMGWFLTIAGSVAIIYGVCDAWVNGLDWENFAITMAGVGAVVGGLALSFGATGAAIGMIIGGVALLIEGIKSLIDDGRSLEALTALEVAILLIAGAIAILAGGWIPLLIGAIAGLVVSFLMYGGEITDWLQGAAKWVDNLFSWLGEVVWGFFHNIGKWCEDNLGFIGLIFSAVFHTIGNVVDVVMELIGNAVKLVVDLIAAVVATISAIATGDWKKAWMSWVKVFKDVWNLIVDILKGIVNIFIDIINVFIRGLNKISVKIPDWVPGIGGKKFGIDIKEIPRLARGGIVNNPGHGVPLIAGEAGREAILPLDRHTEWMDVLAEKINGGDKNIVVQVILSGKKIHEEIINLNKKREFATNGAR